MRNINTLLKNNEGNKTLMVIFPHPDDETVMAGGLLQRARSLGWKTVVVTLTEGDEGKLHIHANGRSIREIRRHELERSTHLFGVHHTHLEIFPDSKLREKRSAWKKKIHEFIKQYDPEIVVTYDHSGNSGHPDHVVVSIELKNIISKIKSQNRPLLLWSTFPKDLLDRLDHISRKGVSQFASKPTYLLSLSFSEYLTKIRAIKAHKSQGMFHKKYFRSFVQIGAREWYHEVDIKKKYPYKYIPFDYDI